MMVKLRLVAKAFAMLCLLVHNAYSKSSAEIPVVDIGPLRSGTLAEKIKVAEQLGQAARDFGFFQIANHTVPQRLIDDVIARAWQFFRLPEKNKKEVSPKSFNPASTGKYRGYFPPFVNGKAGYDIGNPILNLSPALGLGQIQRLPMHEATPFPRVLGVEWQATVQQYYATMAGVSHDLLGAFELYLKMEPGALTSMLDEPTMSTLRFNHYPEDFKPVEQAEGGTLLRCETHVDNDVLTVLYQADRGGLQAEAKDGTWIDVPVRQDAFVVNVGYALQRLTNGHLKATNHRVVFQKEERLSMPFFTEASYNYLIRPLPPTVTASTPAKWPTIPYGKYIHLANQKFKEYAREEEDTSVDAYLRDSTTREGTHGKSTSTAFAPTGAPANGSEL